MSITCFLLWGSAELLHDIMIFCEHFCAVVMTDEKACPALHPYIHQWYEDRQGRAFLNAVTLKMPVWCRLLRPQARLRAWPSMLPSLPVLPTPRLPWLLLSAHPRHTTRWTALSGFAHEAKTAILKQAQHLS